MLNSFKHRLPTLMVTMFCTLGILVNGCSSVTGSSDFEQQVLQVIRNNPEVILESVQAYQQQQQNQLSQARASFLQQMRSQPRAIIGDSPTFGAANAEIVLVEFSDFQCPFCRRTHGTVKEFMDRHQDQVTLVFKHLPLSQIHAQALPAAKAAWAAQQQGKFWEYQNALFEGQDNLGEPLYEAIAISLGLDLEQFNRARNSDAARAAIEQDMQLARVLGISGTPFFVMNGETLSGAVDLSTLQETLAEVISHE